MLEKLKDVLAKVVPDVDMASVTEETRLIEDLEFDSLSNMMMSMEIEDKLGFEITEMLILETVGDVCRYINERIG